MELGPEFKPKQGLERGWDQDQTGKGVGAGSRSENGRVGAEVTQGRKGTRSRRRTGSGRKNKVRGLSPDRASLNSGLLREHVCCHMLPPAHVFPSGLGNTPVTDIGGSQTNHLPTD